MADETPSSAGSSEKSTRSEYLKKWRENNADDIEAYKTRRKELYHTPEAKKKREKRRDSFDSPYEMTYLKAEKSLVVNDDDPDLHAIEIELPKCPDVTKIDGYGKPSKSQYFVRPEVPYKLVQLQKSSTTVEQCLETLRNEKDYYKDEIKWIQREWERRMHGYWFYNNGRPTYIAGVHYFYLCQWWLGNKRPEYRSRDRKFFIFAMMCMLDPFCVGFNYPKFRREGATSKVSCFEYWLITMERNVHAGNQSKDEPSAAEVFTDHIVHSHRKMPFWFAPVTSGKDNAKSVLEFSPVSRRIVQSGRNVTITDSLESKIDYGSSTEGFYDRSKLRFHYNDECGKTIEADIYQRHLKVKPALSEGNKFIGMFINTSTVGDMVSGGGDNFKKLCMHSMYHDRMDNGETVTGLYNLFIPAQDGFDLHDKTTGKRFIDRYGNSNVEETKKYLDGVLEGLLAKGDLEGYSEQLRMFPMQFRDSFRTASGACKFNVEILEHVLDKFRFQNPHKVRGNFVWRDGKEDTIVDWHPSSNGKFYVSWLPKENETNKFIMDHGVRVPAMRHKGIVGGDPFKLNIAKSKASTLSDGAGVGFRKFDPSVDDATADPSTWKTNKFCWTYSNRPRTKKEYGEDMLMACIFYGWEMYPEINVDFLWDYFDDRKYPGYLYYKIDIKTGKRNRTPGAHTGPAIQENIYGEYYNYIETYGRHEVHDEIFRQCRDIQDDMGPFDLFVAGGYALMGAHRADIKPLKEVHAKPFHRMYKYGVGNRR